MGNRTLGDTEDQRDLGVLIHRSLKVSGQVDNHRVAKKVFGMFTFIGQNIEYGRWDIMSWLYKTLSAQYLAQQADPAAMQQYYQQWYQQYSYNYSYPYYSPYQMNMYSGYQGQYNVQGSYPATQQATQHSSNHTQ
eukprot:g39517.t1